VRVQLTVDDPHAILDGPCGFTLWADRARFWADNQSLAAAPQQPGSQVVRINREQLRLRVIPAPGSVVTVLGRAYAIDHAAFRPGGPADLNFLGRVEVDPLTEPGGAYVRGTITSGPLRLVDPADLLESDDAQKLLDRLWPDGAIRLIVFTSGSLQMEVEQIDQGGNPVFRRIAYRSAWFGPDRNIRIWEGIACADSPDVSDPTKRLQEVIDDITDLLANDLPVVPIELAPGGAPPGVYYRVTRITGGPPPLAPSTVEELLRPGVTSQAQTRDTTSSTSTVEELLRPGVTLKFTGPDDSVTEWAPATLTIPQVASPQDARYEFSNVDEIGLLIGTGQPADDRSPAGLESVKVKWVQPSHQGDPSAFLSHCPVLFAAGAADPTIVAKNVLWQPVRPVPLKGTDSWSGLPQAWARYRVGDVPFIPGAIGLDRPRLPNWSGPLTLLDQRSGSQPAAQWRIVLDMEDRATVLQRVLATISRADGVVLKLTAPQTLAYSPGMPLRRQDGSLALADPGSVPSSLVYDDELAISQIVFQHDGETVEGPLAQEALQVAPCPLGAEAVPFFQLSAGRDAARFYPTSEDALIDPASATGGNLQAIPVDRLVVLSGQSPADGGDFSLVVDPTYALLTDGAYDGLDVHVTPTGSPTQTRTVQGFAKDVSGLWRVSIPGPPQTKFDPPPKTGANYALVLSQESLPRDPNHGVVPLGLETFTWEPDVGSDGKPRLTALRFDESTLEGGSLPSVLTQAPWVERGSSGPDWLRTSLARLHHRNLVLEHPEMEVSFQDRTPDGPGGALPAPVLPYGDVIRAVRDRYTQASGNLTSNAPKEHALVNWLPGASLVDDHNQPVTPRLDYEPATAPPPPGTPTPPQVTLSGLGGVVQTLSIDPSVGGTNFLEFDVGAEPFAVNSPTLSIVAAQPDDGPSSGRMRAVNSGAPLIFSPQAVTSLAVLGPSADNPSPLVLVGRADGTVVLTSWNTLVSRFQVANRFPTAARAITGVALQALSNVLTIAASCKDGSAVVWTIPAPGILLSLSRFPGAMVPPSSAATFHHPDEVTCVALDGSWLLTGCRDGLARLWKVDQTAAPVKILTPAALAGPPPAVTAVGMARQGVTSTLLVADANGLLLRFDRNDTSTTPAPIQSIPDPQGRNLPLRLMAIEPDTGQVVTGTCDTQLFIWGPKSATDGTLVQQQADSSFPTALASVGWMPAGPQAGPGVDGADVPPILAGDVDAVARVHSVGSPGFDQAVFDARGNEVSAVAGLDGEKTGTGWLLAGTTAGTLQAWSLPDGQEVAGAFSDAMQPGAIYDNLGVVRGALPLIPGSPWVVESLLDSDTGEELYSVSHAEDDLNAPALFLVEPDAPGSPRYRTEIRLGCAAIKLVKKDGQVVVPPDGTDFETARFTLGAYGLFSAAESKDPTKPYGQARFWPRLGGAPVFPTRLLQLGLEQNPGGTDWQVAGLMYQAALISPLDLTEDGPSDRVLPSVRGAVARGSVVTIALASTGGVAFVALDTGADALFDWDFDVDAQLDLQAGVFPGKLARLAGNVAVTQGQVVLTVNPMRSAALVFGRLWPLSAPLTLVAESIVRDGKAVGVAYRATNAPPGVALAIVQDEDSGPALTFSRLPVDLPSSIGTDYSLHATISTQDDGQGHTRSALELAMRKNHDPTWPSGVVQTLRPELTEGGVFGFVLDPSTPISGPTPLDGALALWNEGDPASPTLGGVLVVEQLRAQTQAQLDPVGWHLVGDRLEMTVVASYLDTSGAIQWNQRQVWSWLLGPDPASPPPVALRLLINEQAAEGTGSYLTAYLDVPVGTLSSRLQAPVLLSLEADDGSSLKLQGGLSHARAVTPPAVAPDRLTDLGFPTSLGTVQCFTLEEATEEAPASSSDHVAGFVQLGFNATGTPLALYSVPEDQVPLDLCLEPDAVAPPSLLAPSVPQLVHRAVFGDQLRITLRQLEAAVMPPESKTPFDPGAHSWLLSPVGPADRGSVLYSQRLWLLSAAVVPSLRTEDVLVLFREAAGPGNLREEASSQVLPSVVSVLSGTGLDTGAPLFPAERVKAAVLQAGATGMVVRRTLQSGGPATYAFEPSPFAASSQSRAVLLTRARELASTAPGGSAPPTIDLRLVAPELVRLWTISDGAAYALGPPSFDPYREDLCSPARSLEITRRGPAVPTWPQSNLDGSLPALVCRVAEVPSFQEAAPLWYVPRELPGPDVNQNLFLPRSIRVRFGLDKPGAMFEHLITPLVSQSRNDDAPRWLVGGTTELALREPQRIRLSDCVTAGVTVQDARFTRGPFPDDLWQLSVRWDELIGRVRFDPATLPGSPSSLLVRAGSSFRFTAAPFLVVVQFDQTVFTLRPEDEVLPIYQVIGKDGTKVRRAPRIFLITRLPHLESPIDFNDGSGPLKFQPYVVVSSKAAKPDDSARLDELFQPIAVQGAGSGLIVWEYTPTATPDKRPESVGSDLFQFVWMATDPKGPIWSASYAMGPVNLNPLGPSPLLPKLSAVVSQFPPPANRPPLARTAFFGNAASPDQAAPRFEPVDTRYDFLLEVNDLTETVQFARRPNDASATFRLDLIKYLVPGQVVSGMFVPIQPPTQLHHHEFPRYRGDR